MQAHAELATLNEPFRLALDAAPTGMVLTDTTGHIAFANQHAEKLFGYDHDELIGMPLERLIPLRLRAEHQAYHDQFVREPQTGAISTARDLYGLRKDGRELPVEIGLNPIRTPAGTFVLSSIVDMTERRRSLQELKARVQERDVLLQEIHHRVKNNLQVISSLINIQARKLADGIGREILLECRSRIEAIALIHEKLYQSHDYSRVAFSEYLRSLAQSVRNAADIGGVELQFELENIPLDVHQAIPCGLIFNELVTNALKHAFVGREGGTIRVTFKRDADDWLALTVRDDGAGMSEGRQAGQSLGLQLVATLSAQLGGRFDITTGEGTCVAIHFPEARH